MALSEHAVVQGMGGSGVGGGRLKLTCVQPIAREIECEFCTSPEGKPMGLVELNKLGWDGIGVVIHTANHGG